MRKLSSRAPRAGVPSSGVTPRPSRLPGLYTVAPAGSDVIEMVTVREGSGAGAGAAAAGASTGPVAAGGDVAGATGSGFGAAGAGAGDACATVAKVAVASLGA